MTMTDSKKPDISAADKILVAVIAKQKAAANGSKKEARKKR